MKLVILMTLFTIIHHSTATIDIQELKNNAKENLQAFHETAATELGKLVASINLENAKKVDIFHVIPKVTKLKNLLTAGEKEVKKETLILDPYQAERLSNYFDDYHHHHHEDYHHHHVIRG